MKSGWLIAGVVATLTGLVWIGQGTGYFPYPASSFMVKQTQWAWYGAILLAVGLGTIVLARRNR